MFYLHVKSLLCMLNHSLNINIYNCLKIEEIKFQIKQMLVYPPPDVVGRGRETELQVGKNFN